MSKQAIYRRWRTKADLVLDAFLEHARTSVDERGSKKPATVEQQLARWTCRSPLILPA